MATFHILNGNWQTYQKGRSGSRIPNPAGYGPGAYCIANTETGEVYIGSTTNLTQRAITNSACLKNNNHACRAFQNAFNENPDIEILVKKTTTVAEAQALEQQLVNEFKDTGYLCNSGIFDVTNPCKGKMQTQEHKQKRIEQLIGRERPIEVREKVSAGRKAFYQTEKGKLYLQTRSVKVKIDNIEYNSIAEASRVLNISPFRVAQYRTE